jgi:TetR/AcrR family transcriptional regulator, cholesterol catabolism regulator
MTDALSHPAAPAAADPSAPSRADVSRQQILAVTATLFCARGYAGTSLRDIAAAVGMKAGSLYYHFASKEELAAEVLRIGVERVHLAVENRLRALGESASLRDKIEGAITAHLETLWQESDFTSAHIRCIHTAPASVRDSLHQVRRDYETVWRNLIGEAARASALAPGAEPTTVRLAILGALNWSLEWFDPKRHKPDEFARTLAASFIRDG